jgi:hypothetical protein
MMYCAAPFARHIPEMWTRGPQQSGVAVGVLVAVLDGVGVTVATLQVFAIETVSSGEPGRWLTSNLRPSPLYWANDNVTDPPAASAGTTLCWTSTPLR